MTLKYHPILSTFQAEREALQKQIIATLQNDKRIVAAWLFGSLGRGTADALSDIDIWLVVADTFIQDIVAHRQQFVAQIQDPAFFVEAPQNAPQDGGYLMAYYDMPTGPHQVDWYWQPQSLAYPTTNYQLHFLVEMRSRKSRKRLCISLATFGQCC